MAFCANCGVAVTQGTGFCGSGGKPVGTAEAIAPVAQSAAGTTTAISQSVLTSNVAGALAYVLGLITGVIFRRGQKRIWNKIC